MSGGPGADEDGAARTDATPTDDSAPPTRPLPPTSWQPEGTDLARAFLARARTGPSRTAGGTRARSGRSWSTGRQSWRAEPTWSGPAPDERDPQPLDTTVERFVAEHGWGTELRVHGVLARWDLVVGPDVAAHCTPERYADTELTVRAASTAWATQLRLLAPTLVRRLNEELGDGTVTRITVLGPTAPSWVKGPRRVRGRGPRDTYG